MLEHLFTVLAVESEHIGDALALRESGRDNRARTRSRDVIEVFAQRRADQGLQFLENSECEKTANTAAVQRQHASRTFLFIAVPKSAPTFGMNQHSLSFSYMCVARAPHFYATTVS